MLFFRTLVDLMSQAIREMSQVPEKIDLRYFRLRTTAEFSVNDSCEIEILVHLVRILPDSVNGNAFR